MRSVLSLASVAFMSCASAVGALSAGEVTPDLAISLERPSHAYLMGAPIPIQYTLTQLRGRGTLSLNYRGVPSRVVVKLTDPDGKEVPLGRSYATSGDRTRARGALGSSILAKDAIRLALDLNQYFDIRAPGTYELSAWYPRAEPLDAITIEVLTLRPGWEPVKVHARCDTPSAPPQYTTADDHVDVQCRVRVAPTAAVEGDGPTFLQIEHDIEWGGKTLAGETIAFPLRASTVVQAELDYRWQLWLVLESMADIERTLMVFDLTTGKMQVLVPWGPRWEVTLGWAPARLGKGNDAKLVFGGKVGEPQFSTYIVSQSGGWQSPHEPPPKTSQPAAQTPPEKTALSTPPAESPPQ